MSEENGGGEDKKDVVYDPGASGEQSAPGYLIPRDEQATMPIPVPPHLSVQSEPPSHPHARLPQYGGASLEEPTQESKVVRPPAGAPVPDPEQPSGKSVGRVFPQLKPLSDPGQGPTGK